MTITATTSNGTHAVQLPSGWITMKLRFLLEVNPTTPAELRAQGGRLVPFLPMEALGEGGSLDTTRERPVAELLTGYSYFENDDVLMAKVTPCFENGKAALVKALPGGHGFGSTEVTTLRAGEGLSPAFLYYLVRSDHFRQASIASMTGAGGLKRVPDEHIRSFETLVPPEIEQRAIADYLDRETANIDVLIGKQEQLIATLREESDALWSAEVRRLNESSPTMPLRRVIDSIVDGPFGSSLASAHYSSDGARVVRLGNIGINEFKDIDHAYIPLDYARSLSTHEVIEGDVVVAGLGDEKMPLGRAALVPNIGPAIVKADCYRIRPRAEQMRPDYLAWVLSAPPTRNQIALLARGSTRARLNTSVIKEVEIPVPSLTAQASVVSQSREHRSKIDDLMSRAERLSDTLREYRCALITNAVTGKIDVREAV